jgi:plastocyanin
MKALGLLSVLAALCASLVVVVGGTAAPGPCQAGDTMVSVSGSAFSPSTVNIAPGGTVCWTNNDPFDHTVTSSTGAFDETLSPNESVRFSFAAVGTYSYLCTVPTHQMTGQVVVSTSPPPPPPPPPPSPPSPPPPPAALRVTGVKISVQGSNGRRSLLARARINRAAVAKLSLVRNRKTRASARKRWVRGTNSIRTTLPRSIRPGRWTAVLQVGSRRFSRPVRIR